MEKNPIGQEPKMDQKQFKELWNKRVPPQDCPYIKDCTKRVLDEEALMVCKDREIVNEIVRIHMTKKHMWELCETFLQIKREKEGKLPKEW